MWNADLGFYYGKRFQLDAQAKLQNMLGENGDSKITILTDREEAVFKIIFADETKMAVEVIMSEFIETKSPKAKGKRFSTLEIAQIEDITPEPEEEEGDDISESVEVVAEDAAIPTEEETEAPVLDVPFTITNEVPEDSKPVEEQLSLF